MHRYYKSIIHRAIPLSILLLILGPARGADPAWQPVGLSGGGAMFNPSISPMDPAMAIVHCDMSAAYLTHDGGKSWRMIHTAQLRSNTNCRAAFSPADPKTIISPHGDSELRISHDGGAQWEPLASFDDELIGPITIDTNDPSRIVVGVGQGVQRSNDGGKKWRRCLNVHGRFVGACFVHAGTTRPLAIATDKGIWLEDADGPGGFSPIRSNLPDQDIRNLAGGGKDANTILYCTLPSISQDGHYTGGVYRSRSMGRSWQPALGSGLNLDTKKFDEWGGDDVAQYYDVATTADKPETLWLTSGNTGVPPPHHSTVYRSDDAGETWHDTFFPDPRYKGFNVEKDYTVVEDGQFYQDRPQIAVDPKNPDHVLQINGGSCYFTTDGGKTWSCGHTQAVGTPQKGVSWHNSGLVVTTTWHYYVDPHEPKRHYISYTDLGFARSLDAGQSWIWWAEKGRAPWRNTCYELAFDPDKPGQIFGAFSEVHDIPNSNIIENRHGSKGPGGICLSTDFAESWTPLGAANLPKAPATAIVLDPKSPPSNRTLYAGFFGKGVYKSTDDGQSWTAKNNGLGDPTNMRICRVQLHPDGTLFALVTALMRGRDFQKPGVGVYRSTNAAESWECISTTAPILWPKDFTLDPSDSKTLYLSTADANHEQIGGLYRTTDGGVTWQRLARLGPEHFSAFLHPKNRDWIYATLCEDGPYGIYLSKDNGKTFAPLQGLPFDNAMRITFDPADENMMYVSTFGGSVWHGPVHD